MTQITLDPQKFGELVGSLVKTAIQPYADRIGVLEDALKALPEPVEVAHLLGSEQLKTLVDLQVTEAVAEFFTENPVQDGKDADPAVIEATVARAVAALPVPKDGADGVGVAGAMIDRKGSLILTTTKGDNVDLGKVVGDDGKDGLSFETVSGEFQVDRGFVLRLAAGDRTTEIVLPYMTHRGFWREGMKTKTSESITHKGALWIAKRDNASKPCLENEDDWYLAARAGKDGKEVVRVVPVKDSVSLEPSNG